MATPRLAGRGDSQTIEGTKEHLWGLLGCSGYPSPRNPLIEVPQDDHPVRREPPGKPFEPLEPCAVILPALPAPADVSASPGNAHADDGHPTDGGLGNALDKAAGRQSRGTNAIDFSPGGSAPEQDFPVIVALRGMPQSVPPLMMWSSPGRRPAEPSVMHRTSQPGSAREAATRTSLRLPDGSRLLSHLVFQVPIRTVGALVR